MCYSVLLKTSLKEISREFDARVHLGAFENLFRLRLRQPDTKIPLGLDRYFLLSRDPEEARLAPLVQTFLDEEKERHRAEAARLEEEIGQLGARPSAANRKKIESREKKREKLRRKVAASPEQVSPLDDRVFPFYYAPVVVEKKGERLLVPMRYRVRRPDGGEVPHQYNVFNARFDSLETARTWAPEFGRHHAIFPFRRFYEWVEKDGKKQEIYFAPEDRQLMWAASLYVLSRGGLLSFAMITDDPPPEVAAAGHDRCPIFLPRESMPAWLRPESQDKKSLKDLLGEKEKAFYLHGLAA